MEDRIHMQGQQPDRAIDLDAMGRQLSLTTNCSLRFRPHDRIFVCKCGVEFPLTKLAEHANWTWAKEKHDKEGRK